MPRSGKDLGGGDQQCDMAWSPELPCSGPTLKTSCLKPLAPKSSDQERVAFARRAALALIRFIEATEDAKRPACLHWFPQAACGDYSLLLHTCLSRHGVASLYVRASKRQRGGGARRSHCWVESCGHIIDGTIAQFGRSRPALYIGKPSAWHRKWLVEERSPKTIYDHTGPAMFELIEFYQRFEQSVWA